jgi:ankyrin repeat protein
MVREEPGLFAGDAWLACATGEEAGVAAAIAADPARVNRKGGPVGMPPLVAVTHSALIGEAGFEAGLMACARLLLAAGADANSSWTNADWPEWPLSALYGAAGRTHHEGMTRLLLDAGANPDDNESVYHSLESEDETCMRLLLDAGAKLAGTNAVAKILDYDRIEMLKLLLARGGDARESAWMHHAILRGRSIEHMRALVKGGADPRAVNKDGISVFRWARMFGREDVVALLADAGVSESSTAEDEFVAACSGGDEAGARLLLAQEPGIVGRLSQIQLEMLPLMAGLGRFDAVKTMLAVGWPLEVKADWGATALNHAVFSGNAAMVKLLLEAGADWRTEHDYRDNAIGTLSWASRWREGAGDYVGCARAMVDGGVPVAAYTDYGFSEEVEAYLAGVRG